MVLGLALFGALVYTLAARSAVADQDRMLRQHANTAARQLGNASDDSLRPHAVPAAIDPSAQPDVFIEVLLGDGAVISSTGQLNGRPPELPASFVAAAPVSGATCATVGTRPQELRVCVERWSRPQDGRQGLVVAGQTTRVPLDSLNGLRAFLIVSAIPALLLALLAS